jgi:hypothetical protein
MLDIGYGVIKGLLGEVACLGGVVHDLSLIFNLIAEH